MTDRSTSGHGASAGFSLDTILAVLGEDVLLATNRVGAELKSSTRSSSEWTITGAAVDSRRVEEGNLFVALLGERTDGHRFIEGAVENGASVLLLSRRFAESEEGRRRIAEIEVPAFAVEDPLSALQHVAKKRLEEFPSLVKIGVTGSNGKTTTKELIASVLSHVGATVKNEGNLNSEIGLPIAVLNVAPEYEFGVFEMGINRPGEMELLTDVLRPKYSVITNVGTAHIGLLGGREGIAREKGKALEALPEDGRGFIPLGGDWIEYLESVCPSPLLRFGRDGTGRIEPEGVEDVENLGFEGWRIRYEGIEFRLPLMGDHNLGNGLAAVAVGRFFGASAGQIAEGVEAFSGVEKRSTFHRGAIDVFEDSYNANLDSMQKVIKETAAVVDSDKLVLVLGAMKELGEETEKAHRDLGDFAVASEAKGVFLLGKEAKATEERMRELGYKGRLFRDESFETVRDAVLGFVEEGDTVLLKGSRVMELERLVEPLHTEKRNAGTGSPV